MRATIGTVCLALALGCGGTINDAEPRVIDGGGAGDGEIDGRVNVHVIDGNTDAPVANARVQIGEPGEEATAITGLTDSTGLLQVDDESLSGPTTITIDATDDGYALATWFGVNGANVTIPINSVDDVRVLPQGTVEGTIEGWDQLVPAQDHVFFAQVQVSQSADPLDGDDEVTGGSSTQCFNDGTNIACDWSLNARVGTVAIAAAILDVDTKGTPEDTDDTAVVVGFAYIADIAVQDGVTVSGLSLTEIDPATLVSIDVGFDDAPAGLVDRIALLQLEHPTSGVLNVGFVDAAAPEPVVAPDLVDDLAGATYNLIGVAGAGFENGPGSIVVTRGLTNTANVAVGAWLDLPGAVDVADGLHSFEAVAEAAVHAAEIRDSAGDLAWDLAMLDGRTEFALPAIEGGGLEAGSYDFTVNAFEAPDIDLSEFSIRDIIVGITRISSDVATFTAN